VAADIMIHIDNNDRGAKITSGDRGGKSGGARADNDNVGSPVPPDPVVLGFCFLCAHSSQSRRADINGRALPDKFSPANPLIVVFLRHARHQ
jgi:hypothetical protein